MTERGTYDDLDGISPGRQAFDRAITNLIYRFLLFFARHWLFIFNAVLGVYAGLPFLAPFLASIGHEVPAAAIYLIYQFVCHQAPERSFFLWDHKMAYCQRDAAIYTSILAAGVGFALVRRRLRPLDWRLYLLLIAPLAVDGTLQLAALYESTWEMRTFTGILFGVATVWLLYPHIEAGMAQLRKSLDRYLT